MAKPKHRGAKCWLACRCSIELVVLVIGVLLLQARFATAQISSPSVSNALPNSGLVREESARVPGASDTPSNSPEQYRVVELPPLLPDGIEAGPAVFIDPEMPAAQDSAPEDPGPPDGFGGPDDEPGYLLRWYPSASVVGQGTELEILRNKLGVDVPVWFQEADAVMLSVGIDHTQFTGQAFLPDTRRLFPKELWNITMGVKHMHQYENGWTSMLMFDVGSASDKPFHSAREMSYTMAGFVMIPARNSRDMWMLGAMYSPYGSPSMPFPIPLVSYQWKPSESFNMSIGFPMALTWKPTERLSLKLDYIPLTNINAIATYKLTDDFCLYGGYQYENGQYMLADRINRKDSFVTLEQQLLMGLRKNFGEHLSLDVSAGYAFDRHYGVGEGSNQTELYDQVELEAGAFLSARLNWNF
jgi:hypothetical protein